MFMFPYFDSQTLVLRPEYLNYSNPDYASYGNFYQERYSDRRVNTNTAPVYTNDNPYTPKQRRLVRRVTSKKKTNILTVSFKVIHTFGQCPTCHQLYHQITPQTRIIQAFTLCLPYRRPSRTALVTVGGVQICLENRNPVPDQWLASDKIPVSETLFPIPTTSPQAVREAIPAPPILALIATDRLSSCGGPESRPHSLSSTISCLSPHSARSVIYISTIVSGRVPPMRHPPEPPKKQTFQLSIP